MQRKTLLQINIACTDLELRVRPVANVHQIAQLRRVNVLVLARHEQGARANELQVLPRGRCLAEIAIDDVDCEEEHLGLALHFQMNGGQPVDENGPDDEGRGDEISEMT